MMEEHTTRGGRPLAKLQLFGLFDKTGRCDFDTDELQVRYGYSASTIRHWRREWIKQRDGTNDLRPRCSRCGFTGWEKSPLMVNGVCLWCNLEREGLDIAKLVEEYGWNAILGS